MEVDISEGLHLFEQLWILVNLEAFCSLGYVKFGFSLHGYFSGVRCLILG